MSEPAKTGTNTTSYWVFAVIGLVAVCGLLAGLLLSKSVAPAAGDATPAQLSQTVDPLTPPTDEPPTDVPTQRPPGGQDGAQEDVRRIVRNLAPARRREVLQKAMRNLNISNDDRPRALMRERGEARQRAIALARADTLDVEAMRKALDEVHAINAKLAAQGTDLTIEVLQLMTPEERKAAARRPALTRRERVRQRREQRRARD
jgi:uncharacterized membrane protein